MENHVAYFEETADTCIECGLCTKTQADAGCYEYSYASFARAMIGAMANGDFEEVCDPVWSCALCGACTARCPVNIDAYEFVYHVRCVLNPVQPDVVGKFEHMRSTSDANPFQQLRRIYGPILPDAFESAGTCARLFFPGCSLGTYAPALTRKVHEHLSRTGKVDGITYSCCGNPSYFMGDPQGLEHSANILGNKLQALKTEEIIMACPSCYAALGKYQEDGFLDASVSIKPLPGVLVEEGMAISQQAMEDEGYSSTCVKDACRDRNSGVFAKSVRQLLHEVEIKELQHNCRNSRCCGSGGLVPLYDEETAGDKRWSLLQEFDDTEAQCMITMCVNCSVALRQDGDTNIVHYLELLFGTPIDWDSLRRAQLTVAQAHE